MHKFQHNPPPVTRAFRTVSLMDSWEYFTLEMRLHMLGFEPGIEDISVLRKAAVSISAYEGARGTRSPFLSPVDFVDFATGVFDEDEPAIDSLRSRYATEMLRTVYKLKEQMDEEYDNIFWGKSSAACPLCSRRTVSCDIGYSPIYDTNESSYFDTGDLGIYGMVIWVDEPCIVRLSLSCNCRGYDVEDFDTIETHALKNFKLEK